MKLRYFTFIIALLALAGCAIASSSWHSEGPPNQQVQVKKIEYIGGEYNFSKAQIGIADPVIVSFTTSGPSERDGVIKRLPPPTLRLQGAKQRAFQADINKKIQKALNVNADPTSLNHELWQSIKSKYPSLTHMAVTLFDVAETYKISEEAHHLPYMWSSSVVCRTIIIELNSLNVVAEWRQELADRSTWTDACASPEELVRYLVPVGDSR